MRRTWSGTALVVSLLVATLASRPAGSEPGQIEISQAQALAGGVTPGDAPGFPVSIRRPGSYRLTSDLLVSGSGAPDTVGIRIEASGVSLDLGGFALRCRRPGIPLPFPCPGTGGSGDGIEVVGARKVWIGNGTISGFARHGLFLASGSDGYQLADLRIHGHGLVGVNSWAIGRVEACVVSDNGTWGLGSWAGAVTIIDSLTEGNGSGGLTRTSGAAAGSRSVFLDGVQNVAASDHLGCVVVGTTRTCP